MKITNTKTPIKEGYKFLMSEFWEVKYGGHLDFDCPDQLINGMQKLRDFFGEIKITSTIRPNDKFGYHRTGDAIDSIPVKNTLANIKHFEIECRNYVTGKGSVLMESMREVGVQGFGIESGNCIHIDFRNGKNCNRSDKYGRFIVFTWDKINGSTVI